MKRRDFVRNLATIPLAAIIGGIGCKKTENKITATGQSSKRSGSHPENATTKQLNVIVHGMFAIIVDRDGKKVTLKAPNVTKHVYKAVTFKIDSSDPNNVIPTWTYQVMAPESDSVTFNPGNPPKLSISTGEQNRLVIDVSQKAKGIDPYWTVELPAPDDICPLRAAPANYFSPCFTGVCADDPTPNRTYKDNGMSIEQHMPLIYVLTYKQIPVGETVVFNANGKSVTIDASPSAPGRLHLFAEPADEPSIPGEDHIDDAIQQLDQLFKPPLTLLFWKDRNKGSDFSVGRDSSVQCAANQTVVLCEERSLYELNKSCSDFLGTETISAQYSAFLNLELQLDQQLVPPRVRGLKKDMQSKKDREIFEKLRSALPSDAKPPSNCMSLVCLQS